MNQPALKIIRREVIPPQPYSESAGLKRINLLKAQLMKASVRYVQDGKDGSRNDRLRTASSLSGIPLNLIQVEADKA